MGWSKERTMATIFHGVIVLNLFVAGCVALWIEPTIVHTIGWIFALIGHTSYIIEAQEHYSTLDSFYNT